MFSYQVRSFSLIASPSSCPRFPSSFCMFVFRHDFRINSFISWGAGEFVGIFLSTGLNLYANLRRTDIWIMLSSSLQEQMSFYFLKPAFTFLGKISKFSSFRFCMFLFKFYLFCCNHKWVFPLMLYLIIGYFLQKSTDFFSFNLFILFIYFWLCWVFVAARRLSLVVVSRGYSSLQCTGFSLRWLLLLWNRGSRRTGFSSYGTRAQ